MLNKSIDLLYEEFEKCREALDNNQGGKMRAIKGKCIEKFLFALISDTIEKSNNKLLSLNSLYKVKLSSSINLELDLAVIKNNIPIIHFEIKDYADSKMYRSFIATSQGLSAKYPNIQNILITAQTATKSEVMNDWDILLNSSKFNIKHFSLLPLKRKSQNNLYILNYNKTIIVKCVEELSSLIGACL